jgi:DNA polymerase-3 subunit gamma/tau
VSYLVLARKYRPQVFEDMVGQDHLVRTLANAIAGGRVAHAYLFCGPRGVGKTTAARILAKALNCEKGPAPVPCNACASCVEITEGRSLDVLEIDGASNRGINEVRELRENIRYTPTGGRSKVYIIDEVHMLTNEAFNALLKTLEEPPPHVNFVFATTEPFKVPGTILSRCQRFDFARVATRKIAAHLTRIAESEGITITPEAVNLVARRARGGVRDALSLMDQIISAAEGDIDREGVERFLGLVGTDFYFALLDRIADEDTAAVLRQLDETYARGIDLGDLAEGLAHHVRDLLLVRLDPELRPLLEAAESEVPKLTEQAARFPAETLVLFLDRAAELAATVRRSEHPRLGMELALAEMAQAGNLVPLGELAERLLALEKRLGSGAPAPGPARPPAKAVRKPSVKPPSGDGSAARKAPPRTTSSAPAASAVPESPEATRLWDACVDAIREKSIRLGSTLRMAAAVGFSGDGRIVLRPDPPNPLLAQCLAEPEVHQLVKETLFALGASVPEVMLQGTGPSASASEAVKPFALESDGPAGAAPEKREARAGDREGDTATAAEPAPEPEASSAATGDGDGDPDAEPRAQAAVGAAATPQETAAHDAAPPEVAPPDTRSVGQIFKDEPMLQKALDIFDGEMLP